MTADCSTGILSTDSASFKPSYNYDILQTVSVKLGSDLIWTSSVNFFSQLQPVGKGIESVVAEPHNNNNNNSRDCNDNDSNDNDQLTNDIRQMQDLIEKLNSEIFKNPRNCTRPPSEYLEVYNDITEKLHHLQLRKQTIDNNNTTTYNNGSNSSSAATVYLPNSASQEAVSTTSNEGDCNNNSNRNNSIPSSRQNSLNELGAKKEG